MQRHGSELRGQLFEVIEKMGPPVDPKAGPGNWGLLYPHPPVIGMHALSTTLPVGVFQGHSLDRVSVVETIWTTRMAEPTEGSVSALDSGG